MNQKKTRHFKLRNLALFCMLEGSSIWAHWNHSFGMYLSYLGPVSSALSSWVSSGCIIGVAAVSDCLMVDILCGGGYDGLWCEVLWWLGGYNIICLLLRQTTFFSLIMAKARISGIPVLLEMSLSGDAPIECCVPNISRTNFWKFIAEFIAYLVMEGEGQGPVDWYFEV